jgi:hypothetical protein
MCLRTLPAGEEANVCDTDGDDADESEVRVGNDWTCASLDVGQMKLLTAPCAPQC